MFLSLLDRLKQHVLVQLFTVYLRYLIGSAFIIASIGMGKLSGGVYLLGSNSKPICDLEPIQQFFRVMADSGLYWQFIGWTQILAGVLLITQRFAKVGALIFFGMILNIFVITVAYDFTGTPVVTGLMLLATLYLLVWDADTLQYLFREPASFHSPFRKKAALHRHPFWSVLGLCLIVTILITMLSEMSPLTVMAGTLLTGLAGLPLYYLLRARLASA